MTYGAGGWTDERPGHHQTAPQRRKSDSEVWTDLHTEAVFRMQKVSANHAQVATTSRPGGRRIGPHALAFLYAYERLNHFGERTDAYAIEPVTRVFAWTDDDRAEWNVKDAAVLLQTFAGITHRKHNRGDFDPIALTDREDTDPLPAHYAFVGVAISSLGGDRDWASLRASSFGLEIPARTTVRLTDGTWIEMSHEGRGQWRVDSNYPLGYLSYIDARTSIPPDWRPSPETPHAWLDDLMVVLARHYDEKARAATAKPSQQRSRH